MTREEQLACLTDRPCVVCKHRTENRCSRWECVFEEEPTERTGHWIEKEDFNGDTYYDCSECGESFCLMDGTPTDNLYNYCPNCGARMAESEDNE